MDLEPTPEGILQGAGCAVADPGASPPVRLAPLTPYLWMLCGSVSFAGMGALAHGLREYCDWQLIAFSRSFLAFIFAVILCRLAGARLVVWRPRILWVRSLAGSLSLVCTFYALTRMPQSDVLTITNLFPLWVALLSWPLFGERPSAALGLALASGLAGVALVQQPHLAEGNLGTLTALVASFATAFAMVGLHHIKGVDPRAIVVHFSVVSALACLACFFLFPHTHTGVLPPGGLPLLMLLGVGATATAGQVCLTRAFSAGPPAKVALVGLMQVVLAMLIDAALFGYSFGAATLLGIGLVVTPTAWLMATRGGKAPAQRRGYDGTGRTPPLALTPGAMLSRPGVPRRGR
jgi:drug/metabolite transporter (DMT)-like permease